MGSLRALVSVILFPLMMQPLWAAPEKYEFDRGHTRIFFEIDHLGFSNYRGMFHEYSGSFTFDEKNLEKSKIDVEVDMNSADMYFDKMNEHLLHSDLLDTTKYPKARFVSTRVERTGDVSAKVIGDLSMHGVTRPVTLDVKFNKAGEHPFSKKFMRGFTATGVIDRAEFGIAYGVPLISKDVYLTISVEAVRVE